MAATIQPCDIAQIETWFAAHEAFARTLQQEDMLQRLMGRYCDRVLRMRGRLALLRHPDDTPETAEVLVWIKELDANAREIARYKKFAWRPLKFARDV
jgi:hypothetical protein